ncbi:YncE family protein [Clostridium chrysemydis]|uniref:YncE family protein n=1 Tax=Clostridium chrysemydis TaxID=2665504 RepID=UPI0018843B43|nr:hypothetical protein [Clostridium chrysemydis]
MSFIYVSNTFDNSISKVRLKDFYVDEIKFNDDLKEGPFEIVSFDERIVITNTYSDSISILNKELEVLNRIYVGKAPKSILIDDYNSYISCSESNSLSKVNLKNGEIECIRGGFNYPYKLEFLKERGIILVCNLFSERIDLIEKERLERIGKIELLGSPTCIKISKSRDHLFVAEESVDLYGKSYLNIYNTKNFNLEKSYIVGALPSDIFETENEILVSNFGDGTINIIKKDNSNKKIEVSGMPISVIKYLNDIFILDYESGFIKTLDENYKNKKNIAVGKEPNAMLLVNSYR